MKRIRLTESQFRKLIAEALIEEAEDFLKGISWDALMDDAKELYLNKIKPIKAKYGIGWGRKDDGSEDYQIYSELWNRYCDLVKQAQQAFLREYSDQGAIRVQDTNITNLTNSVYEIIKKDADNKVMGRYKEKYLFEPILHLEDYREMGNTDPRYKYLVITKLGGPNAYKNQDRYKVVATYPGEEREWDISNYDIVPGDRKDSRTRGTQHRLKGKSTKDTTMNNEKYRTNYVNDEGEKIDSRNPNFTKKDAEEYTKGRFGYNYNRGHGYPTDNRLYNFGESLMRRVTENVIRRLNEEQVPEFYDLEHYIASEILDLVDSGDNQGDLDIQVTFPYDNGDKVFGTVYFYFDNQDGSPNVSDIYPDLKIYYSEFNTYENYECDIQKLLDALKDEGVSASEYLRTR